MDEMQWQWEAGVWEQAAFIPWSRHRTSTAAKKRAVQYAKGQAARTGGALSWAGGVRGPDGSVRWYDRHGDLVWPPRGNQP